jgi:hypothetical protein
MDQVARSLWQIDGATGMPVRVEDLEIASRKKGPTT